MLGLGGRKLGHCPTLRGDKSGPSCFLCLCTPGCRGAQPLSATHPATHPATAHCLTTGPRPRFLGLKSVNPEATANGVFFGRPISSVVPHSGRKPTYIITVPSTAMKIPTCSFLSEPPPWEATWGIDSLPHGAAVSHTAFKCIC